jgi:hypothetical protein
MTRAVRLCIGALMFFAVGYAQQVPVTGTVAVPPLIRFSGSVKGMSDSNGSGTVSITFRLYAAEQGGTPLWIETQNIQPDRAGHYTVILGSTKAGGIPIDLFASGEARWLGVQPQGQEEQPRVMLLAVPYAMKAGDAETVGGLPSSAFVLAASGNGKPGSDSTNSASSSVNSSTPLPPASGVTTNGGIVNSLPLWTTSSNIQSSAITQTGSGTTAKVGINTSAPTSTLDIHGGSVVRGPFTLPATGVATATAGKISQAESLVASSFSSTTDAAVNQTFQWQAEPANNNTASPAGTLNLLYGLGANKPAETGLKLTSNGRITFAAGQTFPILSGGVTNAMLQHPALTVNAGTDLTGGGSVALGGTTTLNLDTSKVPQLATANAFTNNNTVTVNTAAAGVTVTNSTGDGANFIGGYDAAEFFGGAGGGIYVDTHQASDFTAAIYANQFGGSTQNYGLWAFNASFKGAGVYGVQGFASTLGQGGHAAIWGDSGRAAEMSIFGSADDGLSVVGENNSSHYFTASFQNFTQTANAPALFAGGSHGFCDVDGDGNFSCSGTKSAVVPVDGGARKVALYAIEGPENWFEDVGSAHLSGGRVLINLESTFVQTVNTEIEYQVFLTPNGDCKGLYVEKKSPSSFVVREFGSGTASIDFDYRIVAKRKGYERVRLQDKTRSTLAAEMLANDRSRRLATKPPSAQQIRDRHLLMARGKVRESSSALPPKAK